MDITGKRVLITGSVGLLGHDLVEKLRSKGAELILTGRSEGSFAGEEVEELDITDADFVADFVQQAAPALVFNCAAYTEVDAAESQIAEAFAVNAIGPRNLANAVKRLNGMLVHISTDYVFGGLGDLELAGQKERRPYSEEVEPSPSCIYGHSKRFGEELVRAILPNNSAVIRTSWLHGAHGHNFVATILRIAQEREELRIVNDQVGSPTYSAWFAEILLRLVKRDAIGLFHASSRGNISWYDFAKEIVRQAGLAVRVMPQSSAEIARPAPRPKYSTLDVSKLETFLGEPCISWQEGIKRHLAQMGWKR